MWGCDQLVDQLVGWLVGWALTVSPRTHADPAPHLERLLLLPLALLLLDDTTATAPPSSSSASPGRQKLLAELSHQLDRLLDGRIGRRRGIRLWLRPPMVVVGIGCGCGGGGGGGGREEGGRGGRVMLLVGVHASLVVVWSVGWPVVADRDRATQQAHQQ